MSTTPDPTVHEGAPRAPRMSMGRVVELLLTRSGGEHSSVTLSRNAKGETQIEVVVRTAEEGEVRTAHDAARVARELYDSLAAAYPTTAGTAGKS